MQATITTFDDTTAGWERSLYAFLAEKERRSSSRRTVEGDSRMLPHFFVRRQATGSADRPRGLRLATPRRALRRAAIVRHHRRAR
jgi:hypothetical protein